MKRNGGTLKGVYERDGKTCHLCEGKVAKDEASRDHVRPQSLGDYDTDSAHNYRLAHRMCNHSRGELPIERAYAVLDELRRTKGGTISKWQCREALHAELRRYREEQRVDQVA